MHEWVDVADRLRAVRKVEESFVVRGWIDTWVIGPMLLDRVADDLNEGFHPWSEEVAAPSPRGR